MNADQAEAEEKVQIQEWKPVVRRSKRLQGQEPEALNQIAIKMGITSLLPSAAYLAQAAARTASSGVVQRKLLILDVNNVSSGSGIDRAKI